MDTKLSVLRSLVPSGNASWFLSFVSLTLLFAHLLRTRRSTVDISGPTPQKRWVSWGPPYRQAHLTNVCLPTRYRSRFARPIRVAELVLRGVEDISPEELAAVADSVHRLLTAGKPSSPATSVRVSWLKVRRRFRCTHPPQPCLD